MKCECILSTASFSILQHGACYFVALSGRNRQDVHGVCRICKEMDAYSICLMPLRDSQGV
jgi:hypothetical protein